MLQPGVLTTMEEIDAAIERAKEINDEPRLVEAEYHAAPDLDLFIFTISDGRRLAIPREDIQGLEKATPAQAADMEIGPNRVSIRWPQLDVDHYLPNMLEGRYGNDAWMDHVHRRTTVAA